MVHGVVSHDIERTVRERKPIFWQEVAGVNLHIAPNFRPQEIATPLDTSLESALGDELAELLDEPTNDLLYDNLVEEIERHVIFLLGQQLFLPLFYACAYAVVGREDRADQFKPLLDLWHAGLFPQGLDDRNRLILQTASADVH